MLLAVIVTFACLKTAIGLITACANTFRELFPGSLSYKTYCVLFAGISFLIGNVGLTQIIVLAVPILMFLYPMAITLILASFASALLGKDRRLYRWPCWRGRRLLGMPSVPCPRGCRRSVRSRAC